ncbi:MAG: PadR family transcriptional regulator [Armatimonadota bacterium]
MNAPKELVKGNAVLMILSCLARESMHGYRIARAIEEMSDGYFTLGEGSLYPHLHQLEKDQLIEGYWDTSSGRERKYYRITEHGTAELARRSEEWQRFYSKLNVMIGLAIDPV